MRVLKITIPVLLFFFHPALGQDAAEQQTAYLKSITDRSDKIIRTLDISDSDKYYAARNILVDQYAALSQIHDGSKKEIGEIRQNTLPDEEKKATIQKLEEIKSTRLRQQHEAFIALLKGQLSETQVEKIKDGMTYHVFPNTYRAYQEMIPRLTTEQKQKIFSWLQEARELAMDEGSSDDKHKVFGKYKGRINNYLSSEGYDMKKESKDWEERIKKK